MFPRMYKLKLKISLLLIFYLKYIQSVPHKYCLSPLNTSDCGGESTAIFSYYKQGSRCEIKTWRGCPTANMFENEYHCSHYCIGRLKFFGRGKGSWTGRLSESINDLNVNELEELDRLLEKADDTLKTDNNDDDLIEGLLNKSPLPPDNSAFNHDSKQKSDLSRTTAIHFRETTVDAFTDATDSAKDATEDREVTEARTESITGDVEVTEGHTESITGDVEVTEGHTESITGDVEVTEAHTESITGDVEVTEGHTESITGDVEVTEGHTESITGDVEVTEGHTESTTGGAETYTKKNRTRLTQGPVGTTDGNNDIVIR